MQKGTNAVSAEVRATVHPPAPDNPLHSAADLVEGHSRPAEGYRFVEGLLGTLKHPELYFFLRLPVEQR